MVRISNLGSKSVVLVSAKHEGSETDPAGDLFQIDPSTCLDIPIATPGVEFTLASPSSLSASQTFEQVHVAVLDCIKPEPPVSILPCEAYAARDFVPFAPPRGSFRFDPRPLESSHVAASSSLSSGNIEPGPPSILNLPSLDASSFLGQEQELSASSGTPSVAATDPVVRTSTPRSIPFLSTGLEISYNNKRFAWNEQTQSFAAPPFCEDSTSGSDCVAQEEASAPAPAPPQDSPVLSPQDLAEFKEPFICLDLSDTPPSFPATVPLSASHVDSSVLPDPLPPSGNSCFPDEPVFAVPVEFHGGGGMEGQDQDQNSVKSTSHLPFGQRERNRHRKEKKRVSFASAHGRKKLRRAVWGSCGIVVLAWVSWLTWHVVF
jgi:hypothetical protein